MAELTCPYCKKDFEDDDMGLADALIECPECEKTMSVWVEVSYIFHTEKAPCVNGGDHLWRMKTKWGLDENKKPKPTVIKVCRICDKEEPKNDGN